MNNYCQHGTFIGKVCEHCAIERERRIQPESRPVEAPMTERTYGATRLRLDEFEAAHFYPGSASFIRDLVAHIRELQAENAKLKAERRDFGLRVGYAVEDAENKLSSFYQNQRACIEECPPFYSVSEIVEQELNK